MFILQQHVIVFYRYANSWFQHIHKSVFTKDLKMFFNHCDFLSLRISKVTLLFYFTYSFGGQTKEEASLYPLILPLLVSP